MSPRRTGRRTIGAWIEKTPARRLRICFRWPQRKGMLYRITTDLYDDAESRRELERIRDLIGAEIRAGVFRPDRRFPSLFASKIVLGPGGGGARSFVEQMPEWIEAKKNRKVLKSRTDHYESHFRNYIEPSEFGRLDPMNLTRIDVEGFVAWLVSRAGQNGDGVSEKTASNVVRGTVKAFLGDIEADASLNALSKIVWERYVPGRVQAPFDAEERQQLFEYFKTKLPFPEYVSLRLRFQGATPSETRGFNVGDYSRATSTLQVQRSRSEDLRTINPTKTYGRVRPITLSADLAADVATLCGVREHHEP